MSLSINFDGKANVSKKVGNSNTKIQDALKNAQVKTVDTKEIRAEMARLGISGEHVKINDQAQNVKLPTKEQIEAGLKKVQPQNQDEITQEVQKYFEEQIRKDNEKAIRVLPYFPNLQKSE